MHLTRQFHECFYFNEQYFDSNFVVVKLFILTNFTLIIKCFEVHLNATGSRICVMEHLAKNLLKVFSMS